jgi:hypothetical protein
MTTSVTAPPPCWQRSTCLPARASARVLPKHRHQEFLVFLCTLDREVPKGLAVHLILENYESSGFMSTSLVGQDGAMSRGDVLGVAAQMGAAGLGGARAAPQVPGARVD